MKIMARLWLRLTEIYGHKFTSSYGTTPNDSWIRLLKELNSAQIASGLSSLAKRDDVWPPTAVEFRNTCLGIDLDSNWEQKRIEAADADDERSRQKRLEAKNLEGDAVKRQFAKLRGIIGGEAS